MLAQQTDYNEMLRLVAHQAAKSVYADLALVIMVNPDTRETIKTVIRHGRYAGQDEYREININVGGWILNYKKTFISQNIHRDDRFEKGTFENKELFSVIGVPLVIEGIIIGALIVSCQEHSEMINNQSVEYLENLATVSTPFLRNIQKIREYFCAAIPESALIQKYKHAGLIGKSSVFVELLRAVDAAAKCDVRVLLDGKTGTGKELVARSIHTFSSRTDFPFIALDCGAIPDSLVESELFGHRRGAFTGATSDRDGLFLKANNGTLFLDEINNLSLDIQAKLLRVLQEEEVRPVGSDDTFRIDVRIICASSIPLKELVAAHQFREELFYRIYIYPIYIPELGERRDDIPLLVNHFLRVYGKKHGKNKLTLHENISYFIKQRTWQGNIRELENFIERLVAVVPPGAVMIDPGFLPNDVKSEIDDFYEKNKSQSYSESLKKQLLQYEEQIVREALSTCNWNQSQAARKLQISEGNIRYKINLFNIKRE